MKRSHPITTRKLRFYIPQDLPRYWNGNCPIRTHIFNSIAILAPAFERLAISSVLPYKEQALPACLKTQLQGFIGQESAHGSEFIRYNRVLKHQGYPIHQLEKGNLKNFKWLTAKFSNKMHLSLTLAAEHLTAIISDLILREPALLQGAHPTCAGIWRWHAIEEIEHKAVAFDVFETLGGGYVTRIFGMWCVTWMIGGLLLQNFIRLTLTDKIGSLRFWGKCFTLCWGRVGFLRRLVLPYLRYYLPGFHPWQQDNHKLIQGWKAQFYPNQTLDEIVEKL